ncbi:pyridine nucleotide-disulfide oxidoreductase [Microbacterium saccharophilum]|nr:pyridine nucleotide-disulfide oxidoreductase [Microbacterium saccharophilum]
MRRVVVVGNGIAGLTSCETLRAEGFDGDLVVVGAEPEPAYSRPALSKALLKPDGGLDGHELAPASHGATELRGVHATALDADARRVALSDGSLLDYDGLVIASGSRARRLTDSPHEHTLRELRDAVALRGALAGRPSVTVVGGGVLGMEVASGALAAGCDVTLVANAVPMVRQLGPYLAGVLGASATAQGLKTMVARDVRVVDRGGHLQVSADDRMIETDVVVTVVGDLPNTEWLGHSGPLHTDSRGRLGDGVVAAGDVARWDGIRTPLWTSAIEQAKVAAATLLRGDDAPVLAFQPYFWIEQFGIHLKAVGGIPLDGDPEVLEQDDVGQLLRWTHDDGTRTAVSVNWRIPIPKLRRLTAA